MHRPYLICPFFDFLTPPKTSSANFLNGLKNSWGPQLLLRPTSCSTPSPLTVQTLNMGLSWEKAEVVARDRHGWHRSVAQCVQFDAG